MPTNKRHAEVLTSTAYGPDGQVRVAGDPPADEWYADAQAWFLEDLRKLDPPRLVPAGERAAAPAASTAVAELTASGDRGRGDTR